MRPELNDIQSIERYLTGQMDADEKAAFETRLAHDSTLREDLRLHQDLMKGLDRIRQIQAVRRARLNYYRHTWLTWGGAGLGILLLTGLVILLLTTSRHHPGDHTGTGNPSTANAQPPVTQIAGDTASQPIPGQPTYPPVPGQPIYPNSLPAVNEAGESRWSTADSTLPAQTFWLSATHDTVITTSDGIVLSIPASAFLDANHRPVTGTVELIVKEALDAASILKAGLSTRALSTRALSTPALSTGAPSTPALSTGAPSTPAGDQLLETGGMFYIDARKNGKPIRIDPAHAIYAEIPTDSVRPGMQLFTGKRLADGTIDWTNPQPLEHDLVPVDIHLLNFYPPHYLDSVASWGFNAGNKKFTDSLYFAFASLFHPVNTDSTVTPGKPDSPGITVPPPVSPTTTTALGRLVPPRIPSWWNRTHPSPRYVLWRFFGRKPSDTLPVSNPIANRMTAADTFGPTDSTRTPRTPPITDSDTDTAANWCSIDPARIAAIWTNQFNNTLLATREFEQRLILIHQTGDSNLLNLYVDHLDWSLSAIDSLAATQTTGKFQRRFLDFAACHDGKVRNGDTRFQTLREYYQVKAKVFGEAITKTTAEFWEKVQQLDSISVNRASQHGRDSIQRLTRNFVEELNLNLKSACNQLGYHYNYSYSAASYQANITTLASYQPSIAARASYNVNITTTGWCNIDRYAIQLTADRQTIDYQDKTTGKRAVINYAAVYFKFTTIQEYDRVYLYLLPAKLTSFIRLTDSAGVFTYQLNSEMTYRLIVIGYQQEQAFYYTQSNIQPTTYTPIPLVAISAAGLQTRLEQLGRPTQIADLEAEQGYFRFLNQDRQRRDRDQQLRDLTNKMIDAFFPCDPNVNPLSPAKERLNPIQPPRSNL